MLLLSFASQTSHFWQLGGVMQGKMRSLLRLLVKSIIGDRERQADATTAREAHHSASPTADCSVQNTQDTRTDTHIPTVTWIGKPTLTNGIWHFYCHNGTYLLFPIKRQWKCKKIHCGDSLQCHGSQIRIICFRLRCFMSDYQ